ncbi:MAG: DinB family protein [Bacteroidetes bacterium]|nr:DinB family protein [Bacteroidota bacterium]MBS1643285.1 DinB family protein [Bacteroidota bacterium]MBS1670425.1 DinB family protein [Bacteroidota bacterium]
MKYTLSKSLEIIERTPKILFTMLLGLSEEWITCNEGESTWNTKEVIAHLIVCENTNWVPRIRIMLSNSTNKTLDLVDMSAHFKIAKENSLEALLNEFKMLRDKSVTEVKKFNLQNADYANLAFHPKIFEVNLQQLIATWVTHDLSHLTQISRVMAKRYKNEVGAFKEYLKILK